MGIAARGGCNDCDASTSERLARLGCLPFLRRTVASLAPVIKRYNP